MRISFRIAVAVCLLGSCTDAETSFDERESVDVVKPLVFTDVPPAELEAKVAREVPPGRGLDRLLRVAERSRAIVELTPTSSTSAMREDGQIYTTYRVNNVKVISSRATWSSADLPEALVLRGGTVGDLQTIDAHQPILEVGKTYVVLRGAAADGQDPKVWTGLSLSSVLTRSDVSEQEMANVAAVLGAKYGYRHD